MPIAIVLDLCLELYGTTKFSIYPNTKTIEKPYLPIKKIPYVIRELGDAPMPHKNIFFATPGPKNKISIYKYFSTKKGISEEAYVSIIHPTAYVAASSSIKEGVLIEPLCAISSQVTIGFGVYIKRGSTIGHHSIVGAYTDINPGVTICGNVKIGRGCLIGANVVIRDNIHIGDDTVIGMGSVVTKNIPSNCIAYGNPCKIIKQTI